MNIILKQYILQMVHMFQNNQYFTVPNNHYGDVEWVKFKYL